MGEVFGSVYAEKLWWEGERINILIDRLSSGPPEFEAWRDFSEIFKKLFEDIFKTAFLYLL